MARRKPMLIVFAAVIGTLCVAPLLSATHPVVVEFSPALPLAGQTVTARLSNGQSKACWPPATSITRANATTIIQLDYDDACPPQYLMPFRDYVLGAYPADNYRLQVLSCSNNPPPFPSECHIVLEAPFSVLSPRPVEPAPAVSAWLMLVLFGGLVATTAAHVRSLRHRRRK